MVSFQQTLDQYKSPDKYKSPDISDFDLIHGVTSTPNRQPRLHQLKILLGFTLDTVLYKCTYHHIVEHWEEEERQKGSFLRRVKGVTSMLLKLLLYCIV